jgi:hypothetical protein
MARGNGHVSVFVAASGPSSSNESSSTLTMTMGATGVRGPRMAKNLSRASSSHDSRTPNTTTTIARAATIRPLRSFRAKGGGVSATKTLRNAAMPVTLC